MNELVKTDNLQQKEYLSIEETTETLGISQNTLYRYFNRGVLTPIKFKNRNYIRSIEIRKYLDKVFGEKV